MIGMLFNPAGVYKAFVKGRRTKNLYSNVFKDEQLIDMPVAEIKETMLLNSYPEKNKGNLIDVALFILMLVFGAIYSILSLVLLPFVLLYTAYIIVKKKSAILNPANVSRLKNKTIKP